MIDVDDVPVSALEVALVLVVIGALAYLLSTSYIVEVGGANTAEETWERPPNRIDASENLSDRIGEQIAPAPSTDNWTVVTTQGAYRRGYSAEIFAINGSGHLVFANGTYDVYFDADPISTGRYDVLYVASTDRWGKDGECPNGWEKCSGSQVEIVNMTTGETSRLYSALTRHHRHSRWHDVDRINETHYIVAGIEHDRLLMLNVKTNEVVWQWNASSYFAPPSESGGPPDDWTHLNDVEVLPDGRIMTSPRNHDQILFLHRNGTVDEDWTIGCDDCHDILFEQHNPDYIPPSRGGPAVIVAGSENNRIVEFQRENGSWQTAWTWTDDHLNWPRDADRLPRGTTLMSDSLGDRVLEVAPNGTVVWWTSVGIPYEVERLGTGDESAGGYSSTALANQSGTPSTSTSFLPAKVEHGVTWLLPWWLSVNQALAGVILMFAAAWLTVLQVLQWTDRRAATDTRANMTGDPMWPGFLVVLVLFLIVLWHFLQEVA